MNRNRNLILASGVWLATTIALPAGAQQRHTQVHGTVRLGTDQPPQAAVAVQVARSSQPQRPAAYQPPPAPVRQPVPAHHRAPACQPVLRHHRAPACQPPPVCHPPVRPVVAHCGFVNPLPVIRLIDARTRVYQPRIHGHPAVIQKRFSIYHPWVTVKSHPSIW